MKPTSFPLTKAPSTAPPAFCVTSMTSEATLSPPQIAFWAFSHSLNSSCFSRDLISGLSINPHHVSHWQEAAEAPLSLPPVTGLYAPTLIAGGDPRLWRSRLRGQFRG